MQKVQELLSALGMVAGMTASAVLTGIAPAQAFSFLTTVEGDISKPKEDFFLKSVVLDTGEIVDQFSFVSVATIVENDQYTGDNTGAASADKGDHATTGVNSEDPTLTDLVLNLGNNNLNNIVDTEDTGNFQIDLSFDSALDNLLVFERGMNSNLSVQALNESGELIGQRIDIKRNQWSFTGFSIDTLEIGGSQKVGSLGINVAQDFQISNAVSRVRFFSEESFNGPDWKLVGTDANRKSVPEPSALLGLGLIAGVLFAKRKAAHQQF